MKYTKFMLCFCLLFSNCREFEKNPQINKMELEKRLDIYYNLDLYGRVIAVTDTLISLDSLNGSYYYKRAVAYAFFKIYDSSNYYFFKSAKLNYRMKDSYYSIAVRNHLDGKDSMALRIFDAILSVYPNDSIILKERDEIRKFQINYNRGVLKS